MNIPNLPRDSRLRPGSLLVACLGLFFATTAFECPGPEPASGTDGTTTSGPGGAGGTGGSPTSTSTGMCTTDVNTDPANCGACGRACDPTGTTNLSCKNGVCDSPCMQGFFNGSHPDALQPDDGCESIVHRVFVTSLAVTGDMNGNKGAAGGDVVCTDAAHKVGLLGQWGAWLSDASSSPSSRFPIDFGPFVLVDEITPIAKDWLDLTDGNLINPIDEDESGAILLNPVDVWTSTGIDGKLTTQPGPQGPLTSCVDWTLPMSDVDLGGIGNTAFADFQWTMEGLTLPQAAYCYTQQHLYCMEL